MNLTAENDSVNSDKAGKKDSDLPAGLPVHREGDSIWGMRPEDLTLGKFADPLRDSETARIYHVLIEFFSSLQTSSLDNTEPENISNEEDKGPESKWKEYVDPLMHHLFPKLHENLFTDPIQLERLRIGEHQTTEKQMDRISVPVRILTEADENYLYTIYLIWDKGSSEKKWLIHDLVQEK
ncbi:MAG: hypothetical protein K9L24_05575 [Spirochaetia bacterium]|nr:hypothetical protein [Spirochaetia bacterium]MCF7946605.1 hypothetical protein [Spirochaetia bacterium]MCF7952825.1 hypothetical protein [Spirochaetales bacterium]